MLDYLRNLRKTSEEKQQEALNAYLDGALAPQQRQQIEKELAADAELRAELDQMRPLQQQMRQLPRRQVPRNFTLDPALYGRPHREPLIQAYPVLRTVTVLTAFIFIFLLAANVFLSGTSNLATESAEPMAMMAEPVAEMAMDEAVESEAEFAVEIDAQVEIAEEAFEEEAAAEINSPPLAEEAIAGEQTLPAEAMEAPSFEDAEAAIVPKDTIESDDQLRQVLPMDEETVEDGIELAAPAQEVPKVIATEISRQLVPQEVPTRLVQEQVEERIVEREAPTDLVMWPFTGFSFILLLLGIVFIVLLVLTLSTRRRL